MVYLSMLTVLAKYMHLTIRAVPKPQSSAALRRDRLRRWMADFLRRTCGVQMSYSFAVTPDRWIKKILNAYIYIYRYEF